MLSGLAAGLRWTFFAGILFSSAAIAAPVHMWETVEITLHATESYRSPGSDVQDIT
jgi:hypothetical protein